MRTAIASIAFTVSLSAFAQCPPEASLFFGNGMFNPESSARESLKQLSLRIKEAENWKRSRSYLAYNYDEAAVYQLLEVLEQKQGDFDKRFWRWLMDWSDAPSWFQKAIEKLQVKKDMAGFQKYSLSDQIFKYEEELGAERSIVVVAHSQGNFFANNASLFLQSSFYPATSKFKIVSVATPASFVQDDGPYFTLKSDGVIRFIPGALPPNAENSTPSPGLFDHRFVDHYLNSSPTGSKIIEKVQTTFAGLLEQDSKAKVYNAQCWNWFQSLNLDKSKSGECVLRCNTAKNGVGNFMCNTLCESYCSCGD